MPPTPPDVFRPFVNYMNAAGGFTSKNITGFYNIVQTQATMLSYLDVFKIFTIGHAADRHPRAAAAASEAERKAGHGTLDRDSRRSVAPRSSLGQSTGPC